MNFNPQTTTTAPAPTTMSLHGGLLTVATLCYLAASVALAATPVVVEATSDTRATAPGRARHSRLGDALTCPIHHFPVANASCNTFCPASTSAHSCCTSLDDTWLYDAFGPYFGATPAWWDVPASADTCASQWHRLLGCAVCVPLDPVRACGCVAHCLFAHTHRALQWQIPHTLTHTVTVCWIVQKHARHPPYVVTMEACNQLFEACQALPTAGTDMPRTPSSAQCVPLPPSLHCC